MNGVKNGTKKKRKKRKLYTFWEQKKILLFLIIKCEEKSLFFLPILAALYFAVDNIAWDDSALIWI